MQLRDYLKQGCILLVTQRYSPIVGTFNVVVAINAPKVEQSRYIEVYGKDTLEEAEAEVLDRLLELDKQGKLVTEQPRKLPPKASVAMDDLF